MRSPFSRGALVLVALFSLPLAARVRAVRSAPPDDTPAGWLRQRAIAVGDVTRFLAMTRDARVVAFGDVTHGTHETYSARLRGPTLLTPPAGLAQKLDAVLYIRTSTPSQGRHIPLFRVVQLALSQ